MAEGWHIVEFSDFCKSPGDNAAKPYLLHNTRQLGYFQFPPSSDFSSSQHTLFVVRFKDYHSKVLKSMHSAVLTASSWFARPGYEQHCPWANCRLPHQSFLLLPWWYSSWRSSRLLVPFQFSPVLPDFFHSNINITMNPNYIPSSQSFGHRRQGQCVRFFSLHSRPASQNIPKFLNKLWQLFTDILHSRQIWKRSPSVGYRSWMFLILC